MMFEEKKTVQTSPAGSDEYVGKHSHKVAVIAMRADIPEVDYYRNKIKHYEIENRRLTEENAALKKELADAKFSIEYQAKCSDGSRAKREEEYNRRIAEYEDRIRKLEKALVEASIR